MNNDLGSAVTTGGDQDAVSLADAARTTIIRCLNDTFRTTFTGGQVMLTRGILALGGEAQQTILERIRVFEEFHTDNDPYGEHDFGSFEHAGATIAFKIDCYDPSLTYGSENPADASVTVRVMTIMLIEEW
ncbi:MAG: DUF3768 domain-containing protein [Phreatobacter sp.]|uniref:DUF3768 domain-containing protein n=1 Tax=Phreatobacter sp. TaxID=1966341 RepID=UPI001A4F659F|nr:DUF3768 domain-containing protein [Phreatobacter sp.]MBL8569552.1 DUF3768 domain-containing protein [Phreatobacter sp.]